ncbi:hypothetical protein AVEN_110943-1 [Araneus ventricosus]|uniref:RNA-directed DNA polymerase from mobile element jockey n=1 Tax=Araneus ventricosus TaxID=182803 RepID=A0A4Y2HDA0_ARAVE|nr:hypothetical protein AVEN_110943-1 [Araneus ventricosus]
MADKKSIDIAVNTITDCIITSADISIPKTSGNIPKLCKPWWNAECETCQKALEKAWCEEQKPVDFLPSYTEDYNSTFSYGELKNALRKSNPTSPGPDQIHSDMLKHLSESSLQTILFLFNRIWHERVFPLSWLKAMVIPIPKPGKDKQDPNNYRPIALASRISKLLESMVGARLMHVLETSK